MKKIIAAIFILMACKERIAYQSPPPIQEGKCIADIYVGTVAMKQTCLYVGYTWSCHWDAGTDTCERKGEAVGERPK